MNSKSSFIISLVALLGVIVLFIMEFSENEEKSGEPVKQIKTFNKNNGGVTVAFVNTDSVLMNYELVKELSDQLMEERKKRDDDLTSKQEQYQKDADYFQQQVQKQAISQQSAEQIYAQLMQRQQELIMLQDQYSAELAQKEMEMNSILLDSMRNFLGRLQAKSKYDYVLSYNTTGNILFAKDTFDLTGEVIKGLNEEYHKTQNTK